MPAVSAASVWPTWALPVMASGLSAGSVANRYVCRGSVASVSCTSWIVASPALQATTHSPWWIARRQSTSLSACLWQAAAGDSEGGDSGRLPPSAKCPGSAECMRTPKWSGRYRVTSLWNLKYCHSPSARMPSVAGLGLTHAIAPGAGGSGAASPAAKYRDMPNCVCAAASSALPPGAVSSGLYTVRSSV